MITTLCGGSFEHRTGRKWTWGLSKFRDGDAMKIEWVKNANGIGGRWFFEIDNVQYSAQQISPHLKDIQMHK